MRSEVELALSAVVEAGRDPASITSLGCLFEPDAFETALRRYLNKDEQQTPRPTATISPVPSSVLQDDT
jgi:hypothetical protein